jgi:gliding motility-associated-like protein
MKKIFSTPPATFHIFTLVLLLVSYSGVAQNLYISGGHNFSMAVCNDGKIKTWGQLFTSKGADTTVLVPTDVSIPSDLKFSQADAGSGYHVVAIDCNGKAWAFGKNDFGQLGISSATATSSTPVPVTGVNGVGQLSDVLYVSGADGSSYAILSDGRLVSWGRNNEGELGNGSTSNTGIYIPNYVLRAANTPLINVIQVDAGDYTCYALDADGFVWAWGNNPNGELGRTGTSNYAKYVLKADGTPLSNIIMISGGDAHGLALDANGTVWSWGGNWGPGQLGNGQTANQPYATQVVGVGGKGVLNNANYISAGQANSMVVLNDGSVVTFGVNGLYINGNPPSGNNGGSLGQGTIQANFVSLTPNYIMDCQGHVLKNIAYVSDGDDITYAIDVSGNVYVMGGNIYGELGLGNKTPVGCATKLDLAVKYSCGIPDQCPAPNLGPDIPVCTTTDLANIALFTPYFRTYSYTWFYRTNDKTSFTQLTVADTNTIKPTLLGQYMVKVERVSNNCTTCKPGYDTITVDQPGTNATFCDLTATNNMLTFSVAGNGIYKWYKSATGSDSLSPRGNTYTININDLVPVKNGEDSVYSLYVEDLKTYTGTVGPSQTANLGTGAYPVNTADNRSKMIFNVYNTLTLNAVWLKLYNYSPAGSYTITLQILDPNGNSLGSFVNPLTIPAGDNTNGSIVANAIRFPLININGTGITLPPGTGYTLKFLNVTNGGVQLALYDQSTINYPITSTGDIAGRISLLGTGATNVSTKALPGFINWEIASTGGGYPCGRLKVSMTKMCPCAAPKINLTSSTNAFSFCDNGGLSNLTMTANAIPSTPPFAPLNYMYQWYKNGALVTPGGTQDNLSINSVTGVAQYTIRVGHTSVLRSRCYSDTTFNVTLQKPIVNNVISGNDTLCPGHPPKKQIVGVGTVTGGLGTTTYQWVSSTSATGPWTNVPSNGNAVNYMPDILYQTTYFRRIVTNSGVCSPDTSKAVTDFVSPSITPGTVISNFNTICENSSVTISTTPASGGVKPYAYYWVTVTNGGPPTRIPQETGENLVNPVLTLTQNTQVTRWVSSASGGCDAPAVVSIVVDKKVIGNSITGPLNQQICDGQAVQPIVGSLPGDNGKQPTYQWLSSLSANGGFAVLSGATNKDLTPGNVHKTTYYKRVVTSSGVCSNDTVTTVAKVLVDSAVTPGTIVPALPTICNGTSPIINKGISPTGGTTPYTFAWQYSLDGGNNWIDISGFNGEGPLNVAPAITTSAQYRRTVQSLVCSATTAASTIAVTGQMLPGSIYSNQLNVCPGHIADTLHDGGLASGGTGSAITYQWQASTDGQVWTDLAVASTGTSYVPTIGLTQDTYFRRRATNGAGQCDTVFAGPVKITQYQPLNAGSIKSVDTTVCIGSDIIVFNDALPTDGSPNKQYTWVISYEPYTTQKDTNVNSPQIVIPNIQRGMRFKRVVKDDCIAGDTSANVFKVTVLKKTIPDINFLTDLSSIYCNSTDLTVMLSTKNAGKNRAIDWTYNGKTTRSQPDSVFTINADSLVNNAKILVTLTSDPTLFCTETTTKTAEIPIRIDTKVTGNSITSNPLQTKCSTSPLDSIKASLAEGTLGTPPYGWQISTDNVNWQDLASMNSQNYLPATILGDRYYRRIAYSAGTCRNDTTASVKVFVDTPINPGTISPLSTFQCNGDSVVINSGTDATGGTGKIHYQWQYSIDGKTFFAIGKDSARLFIRDKIVLDPSGTIIKFYFKRSATSDGLQCKNETDTIGITVCQNPIIKGYLTSGLACAGSTISGPVITQGDYSPNGGVLSVAPVPVVSPKQGSLSIAGNSYTYTPTDPLFVGKDTVAFDICDAAISRCSKKYLYITYYPVNHEPVVVRELLQTYRNQTISGANILTNDSDPDGDTLYVLSNASQTGDSIVLAPKHGRVTMNTAGELSYEPEKDLGLHDIVYDTAVYWVCDYSAKVYCNGFFCKKDTVIFEIKPYRIFVPDGFSPNEDGVNDNFVIRSEVPLDIELKVYNRWGNLVYENKHYKNDWNGNANRGVVIGEGLPDGTYYVHYDVHDKLQEPGFKYITINR